MALEEKRAANGQAWLMIGSLGIGMIGDYLFYGKGSIGISYPLFVGALYVLFFWQARRQLGLSFVREQAYAWLLTLPVSLLALTFFLYDNAFFHLLNFAIVPFLLVAQTMLLTGKHKGRGLIWDMAEVLLLHTVKHTRIPFVLLREAIKSRVDRTKYGVAVKVLTGIGISLPILLVVLTLLAQADGVFGHFLAEIPRMLFDWDLAELFFRLFLIGLMALAAFGYLYTLLVPRVSAAELPVQDRPQEKKIAWDGVILVTILTIINIAYAAFTVIQISYLFGGAQAVLPDGMTYAEYAKKGFGELVMVTIINFLLLVSFMYLASRAQRLVYRIIQGMLSLLTVCTIFMLVSAYFRLWLYEEAYGYTHTRLLAHAFMIFLFALFVMAFLKIWRSGFSLGKACGVAGIVAYVVLNYASMDAMIAENNIRRYHENGQIDIAYLAGLSSDAVPAIMTLQDDPAVGKRLVYLLQEKREALQREESWQSFNVARYVAKTWLQ